MRIFLYGFVVVALFLCPSVGMANDITKSHGWSLHGDPKYASDFKYFDYANPDAPKGGSIRLATSGTFDSLHPFIVKGNPAPGASMVFQKLMANAQDEPFSEYGDIAETVEYPDDRSWVVFHLRPQARWHDGQALTADDVVWTFNTLIEKGHPFYKSYYGHVKSVVAENKHRVKFIFDIKGNRELPFIMGQMPILPKHFFEGKDFSKTTLEPILGSGAYKIKSIETGKRVTYERVKDWWAKDLPVNKGQYNFNEIVYDVFRDETVLLQALFSGNYDFRVENVAKNWETAYDQIPVKDGRIKKEMIKHSLPTGMQGFAMNIRRDIFKDARVREAMNYTFDFEWSNKQFAYGSYKRTDSYFANSDFAATGLPVGRTLEILEKFRGQIPDSIFTKPYQNPTTSGTGLDMRKNLITAKKLLEEAGWKIGSSGMLEKNGQTFTFEILIQSPAFERWLGPMVGNLKKLGIEARLRLVDAAQYQKRLDQFDFDMTVANFGQSLSPGNEQRDYWGSDKASVQGSRNLIGIQSPVVDALIDMIVSAPNRDELIARVRALDYVLLSGYYVIPNWHIDYFRIAYWDKFGHPDIWPQYGLPVPDTWWYDKGKADNIHTDVKTEPEDK